MFKKIGLILIGCYALHVFMSCSAPSNGAGIERLTSEYAGVQKGQKATEAAATDSKGLTNGSGLTILAAFTPSTDCATSGWPATGNNGDVGYAMKFLLCSILKSPDGPDTVRGGFDRISGFLCAIGDVTYDNVPRTIPFTVSTACFSQTFVTTACTYFNGSASTGPCSSTANVTGYSSIAGVAPAQFERYLTVSLADINYTIAYTATSTTIAAACMSNVPTANDSDVKDAFAFYLDSTTGKLRYEGRFPDSNKRHMRINLTGTVSTDFVVSNVNALSFVQGENFSSPSGSGLIVSVHGTPTAGRRVRIQTTSNLGDVTPTWSAANADDNMCIGEMGATCAANTGIVAAISNPKKFFFDAGSGFTSSKTWFTNHSYLGTASDTVDMDDIWD